MSLMTATSFNSSPRLVGRELTSAAQSAAPARHKTSGVNRKYGTQGTAKATIFFLQTQNLFSIVHRIELLINLAATELTKTKEDLLRFQVLPASRKLLQLLL
jgi:hypothetical protein